MAAAELLVLTDSERVGRFKMSGSNSNLLAFGKVILGQSA